MKRCAIYTRKSTDEGLEQDFNSLHAQREACEAYIKSQIHEGWKAIQKPFDDGGFSGGSLDRPGLQALLDAVARREVDTIVVYKVDRLIRSLADFAKIVDRLDAQGVSFVSVTQQFNTTTSMGRLTLNVLLSFAQFEREVTAERIRDKIAASKKKRGMWMGGPVPLGYDVQDRKLVVNVLEARTVKTVFDLYLEFGSVRLLKRACDERGIVSKVRHMKTGRIAGGIPLSRGNLYQMLSNPIYAGRIAHHGQEYPGQHEAIIDASLWEAVRMQLTNNAVTRRHGTNAKSPSLLKGLVYDDTGNLLSPTHAVKNGRRYRYYVSHRAIEGADAHSDAWRLKAEHLEEMVIAILCDVLNERGLVGEDHHETIATLRSGASEVRGQTIRTLVARVDLLADRISIKLVLPGPQSETITRPIKLKRRGVARKIVTPGSGGHEPRHDPLLCSLIAKPLAWLNRLTSSDPPTLSTIASDESMSVADVSRTLQLAYLAPDIVEAILAGRQPIDLTAQKLKRLANLPTEWPAQRRLLGFTPII